MEVLIVLISIFISSTLQLLAFSFIPLIWWFITARKQECFFSWVGLKKVDIKDKRAAYLAIMILSVFFVLSSLFILRYVKVEQTSLFKFQGLKFEGILPAFLYATIQTSLSEELFFRGFLLKRMQHAFGYLLGNGIQSILFGLLHGFMLIGTIGLVKAVVITILTGGIAFAMGYINEVKANGSIIPSWMVHAITNFATALLVLFQIVS